MPVHVLSPPSLREAEDKRASTWMLRPSNLRPGVGATPEELRWCAINDELPRLPSAPLCGSESPVYCTVARLPHRVQPQQRGVRIGDRVRDNGGRRSFAPRRFRSMHFDGRARIEISALSARVLHGLRLYSERVRRMCCVCG